MLLLLLLPILISGYYVIHKHPAHFLTLHRHSGQLLYLKSAYIGLICVILSFVCTSVLHFIPELPFNPYKLVTSTLSEISKTAGTDNISQTNITNNRLSFLIEITINSLLVALVWSHILPRIQAWRHYSAFLKSKSGKGKRSSFEFYKLMKHEDFFNQSPLDSLIHKSFSENELLMLHMSDRKFYVGIVVSTSGVNEINTANQTISLLPKLSGYRDKDTLEVTSATQYNRSEDETIEIILKNENIVSATLFNQERFDKFMQKREADTEKEKTEKLQITQFLAKVERLIEK